MRAGFNAAVEFMVFEVMTNDRVIDVQVDVSAREKKNKNTNE